MCGSFKYRRIKNKFIITDKTRTTGEEGIRYERQRAKSKGDGILTHTRWNGGRSCPGESDVERVHILLGFRTIHTTYDHTDTGTRTGVGTHKKPKDLSLCESEQRGHGSFLVCILLM